MLVILIWVLFVINYEELTLHQATTLLILFVIAIVQLI